MTYPLFAPGISINISTNIFNLSAPALRLRIYSRVALGALLRTLISYTHFIIH
jgi:hypothetical protein